jgi:hypothetical protein
MFTESITSAVPVHRTIAAGRLSIMPLWMIRASSYPSSPGHRMVPWMVALNC